MHYTSGFKHPPLFGNDPHVLHKQDDTLTLITRLATCGLVIFAVGLENCDRGPAGNIWDWLRDRHIITCYSNVLRMSSNGLTE